MRCCDRTAVQALDPCFVGFGLCRASLVGKMGLFRIVCDPRVFFAEAIGLSCEPIGGQSGAEWALRVRSKPLPLRCDL